MGVFRGCLISLGGDAARWPGPDVARSLGVSVAATFSVGMQDQRSGRVIAGRVHGGGMMLAVSRRAVPATW
jgi:hypothetical protein